MAQNLALIGVQPDELPWMRLLVSLLRHSNPTVPELARQALVYVAKSPEMCEISPSEDTTNQRA